MFVQYTELVLGAGPEPVFPVSDSRIRGGNYLRYTYIHLSTANTHPAVVLCTDTLLCNCYLSDQSMKFSPSFLSAILLVLLTDPPSGLGLIRIPSNAAAAHGQVETADELAFRTAYITQAKRSLNNCAAKIYARDRLERRHHRRSELVQKLVKRRERDGVGSKFCLYIPIYINRLFLRRGSTC